MQRIGNIIFGRNAKFNSTFGEYFTELQDANNILIRQIFSDYPSFRPAIIALALNRGILLNTADSLSYILLGEHNTPLIKYSLHNIDNTQVRNLTLLSAVALTVYVTIPSETQEYRDIVITALKTVTNCSKEIDELFNKYTTIDIYKYGNVFAEQVINILNLDKFQYIGSFMKISIYFLSLGLQTLNIARRLLSANDNELRVYLSI